VEAGQVLILIRPDASMDVRNASEGLEFAESLLRDHLAARWMPPEQAQRITKPVAHFQLARLSSPGSPPIPEDPLAPSPRLEDQNLGLLFQSSFIHAIELVIFLFISLSFGFSSILYYDEISNRSGEILLATAGMLRVLIGKQIGALLNAGIPIAVWAAPVILVLWITPAWFRALIVPGPWVLVGVIGYGLLAAIMMNMIGAFLGCFRGFHVYGFFIGTFMVLGYALAIWNVSWIRWLCAVFPLFAPGAMLHWLALGTFRLAEGVVGALSMAVTTGLVGWLGAPRIRRAMLHL